MQDSSEADLLMPTVPIPTSLTGDPQNDAPSITGVRGSSLSAKNAPNGNILMPGKSVTTQSILGFPAAIGLNTS